MAASRKVCQYCRAGPSVPRSGGSGAAPQVDAVAFDLRFLRGDTGQGIEDVDVVPAVRQRPRQAPGVDLGAAQAFGREFVDGEGDAHLHPPRDQAAQRPPERAASVRGRQAKLQTNDDCGREGRGPRPQIFR